MKLQFDAHMDTTKIALFKGKEIRRTLHKRGRDILSRVENSVV